MLASIVNSILKRYLAFLFEDLVLEEVSFTGKLTMRAVRIKTTAFDALKLPFRVIHGFAGQVNATIPWLVSIYTEPVIIRISDVYVLAVPNTELPYNETEEMKSEWLSKKAYLEEHEFARQQLAQDMKQAAKQSDSFFVNLIASVVQNMQISFENVHICYEDHSTSQGNLFQVGLTLQKLIFETEPKKDKKTNDIIDKVVKLEGLSFYMNFNKLEKLMGKSSNEINDRLKSLLYEKSSELQYILSPINVTTTAKIIRRPEVYQYRQPIIDVNTTIEQFNVQFNPDQVELLMQLLDAIDCMRAAASYRRWRPTVGIKDNSKLWWKFLYIAIVETKTRRRKCQFTWAHVENACQKRKLYTELYKKKLFEESVKMEELEGLERELDKVTILMARTRAEIASKRLRESKSNQKWFSGWWGFSSTTPCKESTTRGSSPLMDDLLTEMNSSEKEKMLSAIHYDRTSSPKPYPDGYIAHQVCWRVKQMRGRVVRHTATLLSAEIYMCRVEMCHSPTTSQLLLRTEADLFSCTTHKGQLLIKSTILKNYAQFEFQLDLFLHLKGISLKWLLLHLLSLC